MLLNLATAYLFFATVVMLIATVREAVRVWRDNNMTKGKGLKPPV